MFVSKRKYELLQSEVLKLQRDNKNLRDRLQQVRYEKIKAEVHGLNIFRDILDLIGPMLGEEILKNYIEDNYAKSDQGVLDRDGDPDIRSNDADRSSVSGVDCYSSGSGDALDDFRGLY